ncbi:UPF0481 protein At3g47200-like [Bidens hawaiensis]|uniref:UPF0481 protein At3g47200-like n=1 Tax=Bidens hawaiensis TaxID=980011 RepID=UPI00404935EA
MTSAQDQNQGNIEATSDMIFHSISDSARNTTVTSQPPSPVRIPRAPKTVRESDDYMEYYVPKVVSIGPYHFGRPALKPVEKLKAHFAMKYLDQREDLIRSACNKLCEPKMVQELRDFYEENSTIDFSDMDFAKMMLLDAFFILYYKTYIFNRPENCQELEDSQIKFAHRDLLLLENQIPYKVLIEVKGSMGVPLQESLESFIEVSTFVTPVWPKGRRFIRNIFKFDECDHILHILQRSVTDNVKVPSDYEFTPKGDWCTLRNAGELANSGIHFKPSDSMLLSNVKFSRGWWRFSANVKLPRIKVNGFTKHILLNLIAYEISLRDKNAWVKSYVCLLDSLIDHPEDVRILRKAWVLETFLGSDEEVAKLFNEIATV